MGDSFDASITDAVGRLREARDRSPSLEADRALARLESALFGAPPRVTVLDRYPVIRPLGQGGSGVVYLAHDPRLDREVAIKVLARRPGAVGSSLQASSRLRREAQTMARSPHPNVVAVYDVGVLPSDAGDDAVYIVMEYAPGPDLARWLATPHPWREVVEVFVAAGRGLAAAHEVGVIHRDFKPANAIVGLDGRVRVLDFGLARGPERAEPELVTLESVELGGSSSSRHEVDLTVEGTVIGTPAYMAPEQHAGHTADASTDQFSFCVALWEGVFGLRPYPGRSLDDLHAAKLRGPPRPPSGREVPGWLVDALRRGLEPVRSVRWPSMDALLDALVRGLARREGRARTRRVAGVVASLGVVGAVGGLALVGETTPTPCAGAAERVAEVWSPDRRRSLEQAFATTGRPYAASSAMLVTAQLDRFAEQWTTERKATCEAAAGPEARTDALLDRRMACFDRQLRQVDAMLTVLAQIAAPSLDRLHETIGALPEPRECAEAQALPSALAPPTDPALAEAVEQQRDRLARAEALTIAWQIPEALALARSIVDVAESLGHPPLLAEALTQYGSLQEHNGDYAQAERTLERAHALALACGHERLAARASQRLVFVTGDRLGRLDDGLRWARISEAEHTRAGREHERAPLLLARGTAYQVAGRLEEAEQQTREALTLLEVSPGRQAYLLPVAHLNLGEQLRGRGDRAGARRHLERAHALWTEQLGPDHPELAMVLHNLGVLDLEERDTTRAAERFREAVELRARALGPEHPLLATSLANLGVVLRRRGELGPAREALERAVTITETRLGPEAIELAPLLTNLAMVEHDERRFAQAERYLGRALALQEGSTHPNHAITLHDHALNLVSLGRYDEAVASYERARELDEASYGAAHPVLVERGLDVATHLRDAGADAHAQSLVRAARDRLPSDAAPTSRDAIEAWLAEATQGYAETGGRQRAGL